jgi:hypothetical protein
MDKLSYEPLPVLYQENTDNIPQWSHVEQTNKSAIHEKKIRVQFLPADASTPAKAVNGISHIESTPAGASQSPDAVTPHATAPTGAITSLSSRLTESLSARSISDDSAPSGLATSLPTNKEEAKDQVAELKNKVARLTSQLKEQGELRQRKAATALEEKGYPNAAQAVAHPNQTAGVPLQWVALLCLISFLVAWIFF